MPVEVLVEEKVLLTEAKGEKNLIQEMKLR